MFPMQDIDARSSLLPVAEEPSPSYKSPSQDAEHKPDLQRGDSTVGDDGQQRELTYGDDRPGMPRV